MLSNEGFASYLTKVKQIKDELEAISVSVPSIEIVRSTLNGILNEREPFLFGVVAHEKIHDWDILWDDYFQEYLKRSKKEDVMEDKSNLTLASRNKGKR
jgi:hypothetical protein